MEIPVKRVVDGGCTVDADDAPGSSSRRLTGKVRRRV